MSELLSPTNTRRDGLRRSARCNRTPDRRRNTEDGEPETTGRHRDARSRAATNGNCRRATTTETALPHRDRRADRASRREVIPHTDVKAAESAKRDKSAATRSNRRSCVVATTRVTPPCTVQNCAGPCDVVPLRPIHRLYIGMTTHEGMRPETTASTTQPLLVNIRQAAEMLSLSRSSIYQLIWNDELTPIRIGRSVRFSVEHLEAFVADRSSGT